MGVVFALGFAGLVAVIFAVLGCLFVVGIVLLIVYLSQRSRKKKRGEKASKALLIASIIFLALPVGGAVVSVIMIIGNYFERLTYRNFRDEWINSSYVTDSEAKYNAVREFLDASEKGDKEALKIMFTEKIQKKSSFDDQLDEFLSVYPGGFLECDLDFTGGASEGMDPAYLYQSAETEIDGEKYYISIGACYQNSENPEKVGIEYIYIKSEEAYALRCDSGYSTDSNKVFVEGVFETEEDIEVREIGVHTYVYTEIERQLTKEQVQSAVDSSRSLKELTEKLGEPNGNCKRLGWAVYGLNEEGVYAVVSYDERYGSDGKIYNVSFKEE